MTDAEIDELKKLIKQYDDKFGEDKGYEIFGALLFSHEVADQIKIFKKAKGRRIIVKDVPGMIDGVNINYL